MDDAPRESLFVNDMGKLLVILSCFSKEGKGESFLVSAKTCCLLAYKEEMCLSACSKSSV